MILKSCDIMVAIDLEVDCFHNGQCAMVAICCISCAFINLPLDSHMCRCDVKLGGRCKLSN